MERTAHRTDQGAVRLLNAIETGVIVALLCLLLAVIAIAVVSRYAFNASVRWSEEVGQLGLMWLTFISAGVVMGRGDHVTMRMFGRQLGVRGRQALAVFAYVLVIASSVFLLWIGYQPTLSRMELPLPATEWPAGLAYLGTMLGFTLITLHAAARTIVILRGGYVEAPDDLEDGAATGVGS